MFSFGGDRRQILRSGADPRIPMMQPDDHRDGDDFTTIDWIDIHVQKTRSRGRSLGRFTDCLAKDYGDQRSSKDVTTPDDRPTSAKAQSTQVVDTKRGWNIR